MIIDKDDLMDLKLFVLRLSDPEQGVDEDNFKTIMKFIIGLIEKDKLLESLVSSTSPVPID